MQHDERTKNGNKQHSCAYTRKQIQILVKWKYVSQSYSTEKKYT